MMTFTVHEPPNPPADRIDRAAGMTFVRDGFSWSAALFTPIWMLAHRLWWPLLAYLATTGTIELIRHGVALNPGWLALATLALSLLIGLEAGTLRRWSLARRGWATLGTVSGRTQEDCERRFFDGWLSTRPQSNSAAPSDDTPTAGAGRSLPGALSAAQA
ncbi:MAG: DUF2628 domain-containing protein [Hyphomicrobiaceae bacterium]